MFRVVAAAALLLTSGPALAQGANAPDASAPAPLADGDAAPPVDAAIVGTWELAEVEDGGPFERFGAEIQDIRFAFDAAGEGYASATIVQDGATYVRESDFRFGCEDGTIVSDDHPTIHYEVLGEGVLRLTDASGLSVRLAPAASETVSPAPGRAEG